MTLQQHTDVITNRFYYVIKDCSFPLKSNQFIQHNCIHCVWYRPTLCVVYIVCVCVCVFCCVHQGEVQGNSVK